MACTLNIKADNGNNSILYKDIVKNTTSPTEAIELYYYTKTQDFLDSYENSDVSKKTDENGELMWDSISPDLPSNWNEDYVKLEEESRAKVYKNLVEAVPAIKDILESRLKFYASSKDPKSVEAVDNLKQAMSILEEGNINESIPKFLTLAKEHLQTLKAYGLKELKNPDTNIKKLAYINKIAQGYNVIQELDTALLSSEDIGEIFDGANIPVSVSLGNIQEINSMYVDKSMEYLADQITKRLPHKDRKEVLAQIKFAARDQTFIEQMGRYMGDSSDIILSGVAVIIKEAEHAITREGNKIAKELQVVTEKMEASYSSKEISDALVYQKENGELHILDVNATEGEQYNKVEALKSKPELYDFLVFFSETYMDMKQKISDGAGMDTRLPTVLKKDLERLKGNNVKDTFNLVKDDVFKSIQRSNLDMERGAILDGTGKPVKRVPAFYQQKYDEIEYNKEYDRLEKKYIASGMDELVAAERAVEEATTYATKQTAKYISTDLPSSLMSYTAMALNFGHKNAIIPVIESALAVTSSNKRRYLDVDSGGRSTIAKNKRDQLKTIGGEASVAAAVLAQAIDVQVYGIKEKDLGYVEIGNTAVDYNSVIRKGTKFTGYVQMGVNFMAGLSNMAMGAYSNFMEAVAGEYYTHKDYHAASKMYFQNMGGIMADVGARTPSNIVNLLDQHYNILQGFDINKIKTTERSKFSRLFNVNSIFFMSAAGEHAVQGRAGLAMLNNTEVFTKSGASKGTLLENHSVKDGSLVVPVDLYVKDANGKLRKFDDTQQNRIANKIGAVNRKAHGNYSSKTATAMQQDARLAMIAKFRGWAVEGFAKRWGSKKEAVMLENDVEGFYFAGGRVAKQLAGDLAKLKFDVARENWGALNSSEKAQVKRLTLEVSAIILTSVSAALLGGAGKMMEDKFDSDDLGDQMALGTYLMAVYQVNRLHTEIFAYANPMETVKLMRSPFATLSIIENTLSLMLQAGISPFENYETGYRKGQNKALVKLGRLIPIYKQLETLNPDGIKERTKFFN